jgi:hypothetical protein
LALWVIKANKEEKARWREVWLSGVIVISESPGLI